MNETEDQFEVVIFNDDSAMLAEDLESVDSGYIEGHGGIYSRRAYTRAQCDTIGVDVPDDATPIRLQVG